MLVIHLPVEIEARLDALAERTGQTKIYYVQEAIQAHLDNLEDYYLAMSRLEDVRIPLAEMERRLDR